MYLLIRKNISTPKECVSVQEALSAGRTADLRFDEQPQHVQAGHAAKRLLCPTWTWGVFGGSLVGIQGWRGGTVMLLLSELLAFDCRSD